MHDRIFAAGMPVQAPTRQTGPRSVSSRMALVLDATARDNGGLVLSAIRKINAENGTTLEILFVNLPTELTSAELIIRECYGYYLSSGARINCTVYPSIPEKPYPIIYSNAPVEGLKTTLIEPLSCPPLNLKPARNSTHTAGDAAVVAVGGTFDHFHTGHKLLITLAGLWCREKLIVGITGPELLKNKKFAEALDSFDKRRDAVGEFLHSLFPKLQFDPHEINDVYGPTGTVAAIDGLTVSQETASGGAIVNELRSSKGWNTLDLFEVGLIETLDGTDKISSTQLREADLAQRL